MATEDVNVFRPGEVVEVEGDDTAWFAVFKVDFSIHFLVQCETLEESRQFPPALGRTTVRQFSEPRQLRDSGNQKV